MMRWRRESLIPVFSSGVAGKSWPAAWWLLMGWGEWEELLSCDQGACTKVACLCALGVVKAGRGWCVIAGRVFLITAAKADALHQLLIDVNIDIFIRSLLTAPSSLGFVPRKLCFKVYYY